jgi:hypothetical protein
MGNPDLEIRRHRKDGSEFAADICLGHIEVVETPRRAAELAREDARWAHHACSVSKRGPGDEPGADVS